MRELLKDYDIPGLVQLMKSKQISPVDVMKQYLEKIEEHEPRLQAWVTITGSDALQKAELVEKKIMRGEQVGLLAGIPYAAKDVFCTAGIKTTAGSKVMENYVPDLSATSITLLEQEDAILLGKSTTTEFAYAITMKTRNPWDIERTSGGSSSGSSAAVASGMSAFALGTQTGGSLIRPTAFCGLVSMKATLGRLSRAGVLPVSWTLDHIGAMTRTVKEQALLLHVLSGFDPQDRISLNVPKINQQITELNDLNGIRIGVPTRYFFDGIEEDVGRIVKEGIQALSNRGAQVIEIDLPDIFEAAIAAHSIIIHSEAASYHEETFNAVYQKYSPYLQEKLSVARIIPTTTYLKAQEIRTLYIEAIYQLFEQVDVIMVPSAPTTAPKGEGTGDSRFNSPFTMAGVPALTVPCGLASNGLPVGMQIVGKALSEEFLLRIGAFCEATFDFNKEAVLHG